jgi:hypothetical protein
MDPKQLGADGSNRITDRFAQWTHHGRDDAREHDTARLFQEVAPGAHAFELGCGGAAPTTSRLAAPFKVTEGDRSTRHIALAQQHVTAAAFVSPAVDRGTKAGRGVAHVGSSRERTGLWNSVARQSM